MRRFPALYRMPVVYLTAAIVAGTWASVGGISLSQIFGGPRVSSVSSPIPSPQAEDPRTVDKAVQPLVVRPVDSILRGSDALRRKVLVTGRHAVLRRSPNGEPSGDELPSFAIRFVYVETPTMIQVGGVSGRAEGWISVEDVVEWKTRLVARPTNRTSRPSIEIYGEQTCLSAALNGRVCPRHGGRCPTEIENGSENSTSPRFGWPILSYATIPASGSMRIVDEVALLPSEVVPTEAERLAPLRPALRHVYVAFVIDTTASMKPTIEAARTLANNLTRSVTQQFSDITLHLGLVEYRDDAPGLGFRARVATPFTDAAGFSAVINSLEAAIREDLTPGESVFEGVGLALPGSSNGLDWPIGRTGELATKIIVLLGDAPDHAQNLDQANSLAARARAAGISIATVALDPPGSLSTVDRARFNAQWRILAEGAYRPPDRANKFVGPVLPLAIRAEGAERLVPRLQALIEDRVDRARGLAELAAAEDGGRLDDYLQSHGITRSQVTPVLDDLRRGDISPKRTKRLVPVLRTGWLAQRQGDTQFVTDAIWISRDEIDVLIKKFSSLSASDANELRAIVNAAASGELDFLADDLQSLSVEDQMRRRRNFPSLHPDPGDTDARLKTAISGLTKRRDSIPWNDSAETIEGRASIPFDLIDF